MCARDSDWLKVRPPPSGCVAVWQLAHRAAALAADVPELGSTGAWSNLRGSVDTIKWLQLVQRMTAMHRSAEGPLTQVIGLLEGLPSFSWVTFRWVMVGRSYHFNVLALAIERARQKTKQQRVCFQRQ